MNNIGIEPFQSLQWYLGDPESGAGINAAPIAGVHEGRSVRIGIVDDGVHLAHRDLAGAVSLVGAWDHRDGDANPSSGPSDNHGTHVAGLIAARRDGYGIVGAAPEATIVPQRVGFGSASVLAYERALEAQRHVDVSNNSWGFVNPFQDNLKSPAYAGLGEALETGAAEGRGGRGTVFVFAAGDGGLKGDNVNAHGLQGSRFVATVAGVDREGRALPDGRPGAAILVSAPGEGLLSTDAPGAAGRSSTDHATVSGDSFSAALVSGVAARMLDANPALGYRDVQIILAATARASVVEGEAFAKNAGGWLNGGGPAFSHRVGFGVVDAAAAVRLAEAWVGTRTEADAVEASVSLGAREAIPSRGTLVMTAQVDAAIWVERAVLDLAIDHGRIGELRVSLISPWGTKSVLLDRPGARPGDPSDGGTTRTKLDFAFSSVAPMGENAAGSWKVLVEDLGDRGVGSVVSGGLSVFGTRMGDDRAAVQVFTDEFASNGATLRGTAARDTILAAALSDDCVIDLRPGAVSSIAGRSVRTASGPFIEVAVGGVESDRLYGNGANNELRGGPGDDRIEGLYGNDRLVGGMGDDTLFGQGGNDMIEGGPGDDVMWGGPGRDSFVYRAPDSGRDLIRDFRIGEDRLDLSDLSLSRSEIGIATVGGRAVVTFGDTVISFETISAAALAAHLTEVMIL